MPYLGYMEGKTANQQPKKETAMKKNTPITNDSIIIAGYAVSALCCGYSFKRSRQASFWSVVGRFCLISNIFGDTRKLVRDTINAMDLETYQAAKNDHELARELCQARVAGR